ncbi:hypothetical protein GGTG_13585 [Gaeumannomyces tritici R3-111a-1]|uniref:Uncharacterized protein n=1 Tax=Gaeumannomyces tritici (strain R3-111a-1) TaxID=644352 RepID=J3PJA4_GAET3|nr:hypothetical protein GGTG_13585 [Gaeumannomyces tritici R3-111a-1]EJT68855.1 hypothetical protein GGTG_13585 [Gaeumannomyces tritici R3-111a-1]
MEAQETCTKGATEEGVVGPCSSSGQATASLSRGGIPVFVIATVLEPRARHAQRRYRVRFRPQRYICCRQRVGRHQRILPEIKKKADGPGGGGGNGDKDTDNDGEADNDEGSDKAWTNETLSNETFFDDDNNSRLWHSCRYHVYPVSNHPSPNPRRDILGQPLTLPPVQSAADNEQHFCCVRDQARHAYCRRIPAAVPPQARAHRKYYLARPANAKRLSARLSKAKKDPREHSTVPNQPSPYVSTQRTSCELLLACYGSRMDGSLR